MQVATYNSGAADRFQADASLCRDLAGFAKTYGVDLTPLAQSLALDVSTFNEFQRPISLDRVARLFEVLASVTGDATFGLRYGLYYTPGGTGSFGYGLANAPTMQAALEFITKFYCTVIDLPHIRFTVGETEARIEWGFSPIIVQRTQFNDFLATVTIRHMRNLAGANWRPKAVDLERPAPSSAAPFRNALAQMMRFETKMNCIHFTNDILARVNPASDGRLFELMTQQCTTIVAERAKPQDFVERVRQLILAALARGESSAADIAGELAVSERSLHRRMAERDTTYQEQLDAVRQDLSGRLLSETKVPLSEIAHRLGYASAAAYTRAARRWHGCAPSDIRVQTSTK